MVKGFIITSDYDVGVETIINLYGRLEDGRSFLAHIPRKPYFFIKTADTEDAKQFISGVFETSELKNLDGEAVTKIVLTNPKDVPPLRKTLEDHDIACYEADIRFTQRYLMDKHILATVELVGKEEKGNYTDVVFNDPVITPVEANIQPTILSYDIETDRIASRVYSIAIHTEKEHKVLVVQNGKIPEREDTIIFKDEETLLHAFIEEVKASDPDIVTGWNVIDFDFQVLSKRAKAYRIPFTLGRGEKQLALRLESSFFRDSNASIQGRVVLDGIQLLKSSFVKLDDYKLNTAAKHFLKDTKLIQENERFDIIDKMYFEDPEHFLDYNLKDAKLVTDILDVSGTTELTIQRAKLTGLHMDRVKASIASFDSLYLRELREKGYVAPSTRAQGRDNEGLGGYVLSSKPGIYKNVIVLDFKSLYPSIMRTFNIDPLAFSGTTEEITQTKEHIVSPNGAMFSREEGILPHMLSTLWDAREVARKNKNELARYAIKILMNSMYGVLASPNSRFHQRDMSNAITYFGQHLIKETVSKLREQGYEVIYGDTDSVFVHLNTDDETEADNIGKQIEKDLNKYFTNHIKEEYKRESILELEYEKLFIRFFMPKTRGSDSGAKKRYAGKRLLSWEKGTAKTKLDFTGLEFVRRDWTEVAKVFQLHLLDLIFADKEVDDYIRSFAQDIKAGKYDDKLVYKKALRKDVNSYTKTTPPHVKAARLMKDIEGSLITYILTVDGPQPVEVIDGNIENAMREGELSAFDYDHYIEKQIKPIADSVLGLKGENFDDMMKGSSQKGLGSFF